MERYLKRLIKDMREAASRVPPAGETRENIDMVNQGDTGNMAPAEQFIDDEKRPLEEIVGIPTIELPPEENLTIQQMKRLYKNMEKLLKAYNFVPFFPEGLPVNYKYSHLRKNWSSPQFFDEEYERHLQFCGYVPEKCPFPEEYCDCRKRQYREWAERFRQRMKALRDSGWTPY